MTHDELMNLILARTPRGDIVAFDGAVGRIIYNEADINPEFRKLLDAALYMYKVLAMLDPNVERLVDFFETSNDPASAAYCMKLASNIKLALRVAIEGSSHVVSCQREQGT